MTIKCKLPYLFADILIGSLNIYSSDEEVKGKSQYQQ